MSIIIKYKRDIKKAIDKNETGKIGQILSSASPQQRSILKKYITTYKKKQLKTDKSKKKKAKVNKATKITRALYDKTKRKTTKSAKTILKGFGLA